MSPTSALSVYPKHLQKIEVLLRLSMEEASISETERLQIQQIRELESEELQVEEIDDDDDDELSDEDNHCSSSGVTGYGEYVYDASMVALHSYLGEFEDAHNRPAFFYGGTVLTLPLFYLQGVVLFPEATLPMKVIVPDFIIGLEQAMNQADAPNTIGVVHVYRDSNNGRRRFLTIGTTAEIRLHRRLEDGSVSIVARGQQRFHLKRRFIGVGGTPCGEVQVIREDLPLRTPREAAGNLTPLRNSKTSGVRCRPHLKSQISRQICEDGNDSDAMSEESYERELSSHERRLHQSALITCYGSDVNDEPMSSDDEKFARHSGFHPERLQLDIYTRSMHSEHGKQTADVSPRVGKRASSVPPFNKAGLQKNSISQLRDISGTFWPSWVYRMFDSYSLARKAADRWKQIVKAPNMDRFVKKPDLLSFHIASKIPVPVSTRRALLEIDGTSYRLRREIELLESFDQLRCRICRTLIARRSDMFIMSSHGPLSTCANSFGFEPEVLTLIKTNGVGAAGPSVEEFSWFPGYAWSIAECMTCGKKLGWQFSATKKKMRPPTFWGIRSSLVMDNSR